MTIGFVITRHITNKTTAQYWLNCYTQIRKFYPENEILIIDDNSNPEFITEPEEPLINCKIINSEFPKRGEILAYYYFHKLKPFDKAVVLHDSVFLNSYIDFDDIEHVKFLWSIATHAYDNGFEILRLIQSLNNSREILNMINNQDKWTGCFGVMSIISWKLVDYINKRYDFFPILVRLIDNREKRMALERIFAAMCYCCAGKHLVVKPDIFSDILTYYEPYGFKFGAITFTDYTSGLCKDLPIVKGWTGR